MSKIAKSMAVLGVVAGLGVAALPLSSYAAPAESTPVTIRAKVDSSLAVTSDAPNNVVDLGTVNATSGTASNITVVTVTGTENFYNLGVMDQDNDLSMNWVDADGTTSVGGTPVTKIPAITAAADNLTGGWGFRINDGVNTTPGQWQPIVAYDAGGVTNLVQNKALDKTNGSTTNVEFGVNVEGIDNLENGIYEDVVVFVATPGTNTGA